MSTINRKDIVGDVIDVTDSTIKVLFACSGNLDHAGDILSDTALSTAAAPVPLMWRHFLDQLPLGSVERIERRERKDLPADVQRSFPDVSGGWVGYARVYKSDRGRELLDILRDGFVGGASFGYGVKKARQGATKSGKSGRVLEDLALYEVSVLEPGGQCNPAAMTIKSYAAEQIQRKAQADEILRWWEREVAGPARRERYRRNRAWLELKAELAAIGLY